MRDYMRQLRNAMELEVAYAISGKGYTRHAWFYAVWCGYGRPFFD